jgi:DNA-binding NarL/FixJ family response regulator
VTTSGKTSASAHDRQRAKSIESGRLTAIRPALGAETRTGPRVRVLLVEPCDTSFANALDALSDARTTRVVVDRAFDTSSALEIAARRPPDVALVSFHLSPEERFQLIDALGEAIPSLPAVLLVERRGQAASAAARDAGATAFLVISEARAGVLERALTTAVAPRGRARTSSPPPLDALTSRDTTRSLPR